MTLSEHDAYITGRDDMEKMIVLNIQLLKIINLSSVVNTHWKCQN